MLDRPRDAEMLDLRLGEGLVDGVDRPARHARLVERVDPVRRGVGLGDLADALVQRLAVLRAQRRRACSGWSNSCGAPSAGAALPQVVARRGDVDVAVAGREHAGRDRGRMIVAGLLGDLALHQPARGLEVEHEDLRLDQRGVDPLALAGALAIVEREDHRLGQQQARGEVGDRDADPHRAAARLAGDRHQPAHALRDLVDAGPCGVGAALAEARDRAVDDARIDLGHRLVVDLQPVLHVGAVVLDHDVGVLASFMKIAWPSWLLRLSVIACLLRCRFWKSKPWRAAASHRRLSAPPAARS